MIASGVGLKAVKAKTATTQPSWRLRTKVFPSPPQGSNPRADGRACDLRFASSRSVSHVVGAIPKGFGYFPYTAMSPDHPALLPKGSDTGSTPPVKRIDV